MTEKRDVTALLLDNEVAVEDESPQAAWERIGLEDAWTHDYPDVRGFA